LSALRLELSPSPRLALLMVALHGAAGAAALAVVGGIAGGCLGVALLALGASAAWRHALHRGPTALRTLELEGTGVVLTLANGRQLAGELAGPRFVSRFAVAMSVRRSAARTIFVTPDMLDHESFRALRLWALWGKVPGVAAGQLQG
jgi:hypothetical protein